ncbi:MAG: type II toxin-antitoxin system PemK/MazF family toxin [Armatimonadetes bacterium]|nr:type II toxin-antitoxin system PemK/MazF family toxin [Armatimonadota bacterium]
MRTIAKSRLIGCVGHLAPQTMLEVDAALRVALSL